MYGQRISLTHLQYIAILVPAVAKSCKPTLRLANMKKMNKEDKESTGYNSGYVAIAGEVVNRRSVLLRNFGQNGQASDSNPLLHIHAKRCATL